MSKVNFQFTNNVLSNYADKIEEEVNKELLNDLLFKNQSWLIEYEYKGSGSGSFNFPDDVPKKMRIKIQKIISEVRKKYGKNN